MSFITVIISIIGLRLWHMRFEFSVQFRFNCCPGVYLIDERISPGVVHFTAS